MPDPFRLAFSRIAGGVGRVRGAAAFVLLFAVAAILYAFRLGFQSYWDDEISTLVVCKAPLLKRVVAIALLDVSPPLYYVLLGAWERTSDRETWMRLLSVVFALAALPFAHAIGRRTVGRRAAHVAVLLLATLPLAVYCAQEVRPYALFHLATAVAAWALLHYEEAGGRGRWIALAVAVAAMLYSHYYGLFVAAGFFVHAVWSRRGAEPPAATRARNAALAIVMAGAAFLPWTPALLYQLHGGQSWRPRPGVGEVLGRLLVYFTTGHTPRVLPDLVGVPERALLVGVALAIPLVVLLIAGILRLRSRDEADASGAGLLAFWLAVPVLLILATSRVTPILNERAALGFYVPAALLAGRGAVRIASRSRAAAVLLVGGLAVIALASLRLYYFDPTYAKQDWRGLADRVAAEARADEVVLFHSESRELGFRYYNDGRVPLRHVFRWIPPEPLSPDARRARIDQTARDLAAKSGGVWYVDYHAVGFDRERRLETRLAESFAPVGEWSRYDGAYRFRVVHFRRLPQADANGLPE